MFNPVSLFFHKVSLLPLFFISIPAFVLVRLVRLLIEGDALMLFVCASCRRRKGEKLFLVAFYECNEDFELENLEQDRLYCSREAWVGDAPKCMAINDDDGDDEEGL